MARGQATLLEWVEERGVEWVEWGEWPDNTAGVGGGEGSGVGGVEVECSRVVSVVSVYVCVRVCVLACVCVRMGVYMCRDDKNDGVFA